jgi:hypothetical protein
MAIDRSRKNKLKMFFFNDFLKCYSTSHIIYQEWKFGSAIGNMLMDSL